MNLLQRVLSWRNSVWWRLGLSPPWRTNLYCEKRDVLRMNRAEAVIHILDRGHRVPRGRLACRFGLHDFRVPYWPNCGGCAIPPMDCLVGNLRLTWIRYRNLFWPGS